MFVVLGASGNTVKAVAETLLRQRKKEHRNVGNVFYQ